MKSRMIGTKAAILLSSTDTMFANSMLIPILAYLFGAFPNEDPTKVALLITIVNAAMIPAVLLTGKLCQYIGKKTLIIIGTVLFAVGGFAGGLYDNLDYMLLCRVIMGIGAGVVFALPQAFIIQLFEGRERATLLGWTMSVGSIFSIVFSLVGGILGAINWHYCFYAFVLYAFIIILQIFKLPSLPPDKKDETVIQEAAAEQREKIAGKMVLFSTITLLGFTIYYLFTLNMSSIVIDQGFGSSVEAGFVSSVMTVVGLAFTAVFGLLFARIRRWVLIIVLTCMSLGFVLCYIATGIVTIYVAAAILGVAGVIAPYVFARMSLFVPKSRQALCLSVLSTAIFLGMFASTYLQAAIAAIFGAGMKNVFMVAIALSTAFLVVAFVYILFTRQEDKEIGIAMQKKQIEEAAEEL